MRNHLCFLRNAVLGLMAIGISASLLTSCKWFDKGHEDAETDSITWCTVSYEDSMTVMQSQATQSLVIDLPIGADTSALDAGAKAAVRWIYQQVLLCSYPSWTEGGIDPKSVPALELTDESVHNFLQACGKQGLDSMVAEMTPMAEEGFGGGYINGLRIELEAQTLKYLTLSTGYEVYTGGAHGGFIAGGATFRKSDGQLMGWNMFDMSKKDEIRAALIRGVKSYFNDFEEEKVLTDEDLYERLILWDDPETPENELEDGLPFPKTEPTVTPNGISIVYQQYEIAAYACGLPSFILSFEEAAPLLSEEGKELLGIK